MLPSDNSLRAELARRGITRREFLGFCAGIVATLALPPSYVGRVSKALQNADRPVLVWLEFQDCAGNTESMLRSSHPSVADVVLETLSWRYHETIMAGAGTQAEDTLQEVITNYKGQYLAVVEGSIPLADGGVYCTIGGKTAQSIAKEVCSGAAATLAVGACAWDGGIVAPGPTGAVGISEAVPNAKVVNLGGCPHNAVNTVAVLTHYLTFKQLPALDQYNRPLFAYGNLIHDQCERRAHFDAGRFVEEWGDEGHRKGWCLYKMGCKGPDTNYNCPIVQWNDGTSWPVRAGHGCIGCAAPHFWEQMSPFYGTLPRVKGFPSDVTAGEIGVSIVGLTAVAFGAHGVGSLVRSGLESRDRGEEQPAEVAGTLNGPTEEENGHASDRG